MATKIKAVNVYPVDAVKTLAFKKAFTAGCDGDLSQIKKLIYTVEAKENGESCLKAISFQLAFANSIFITPDWELVVEVDGNAKVLGTTYLESDLKRMRKSDEIEDTLQPVRKKKKKKKKVSGSIQKRSRISL